MISFPNLLFYSHHDRHLRRSHDRALGVSHRHSSVKVLIPITLDLQAGNYAQWQVLFDVALEKYVLDDHIHAASSSTPDAQWLHLDTLVRS